MAQEFEKRPDGMPLWKDVSGKNVSCTEKVKVLDENYRELRESVSAALDDAVLIGCRADDIRTILKEIRMPARRRRSDDAEQADSS